MLSSYIQANSQYPPEKAEIMKVVGFGFWIFKLI
jgi:hypothetical protein